MVFFILYKKVERRIIYMKKRLGSFALALVLLMTFCVIPTFVFADTRTEEDTSAEGYRYVITTKFNGSSTVKGNSIYITCEKNHSNKTIEVNRSFHGEKTSWSKTIGANAKESDLKKNMPADYGNTHGKGATFRILLKPGRTCGFYAYRKTTTWSWTHTKQRQHRKANSKEWENVGSSKTSRSTVKKNYTDIGYVITP